MSSKAAAGWYETLVERPKVFMDQVRTEMKKVTWPSKEDVKTYTTVVIVSTITVCILMGLWDQVLQGLMKIFIRLSAG